MKNKIITNIKNFFDKKFTNVLKGLNGEIMSILS